jgi:hypothetical protein
VVTAAPSVESWVEQAASADTRRTDVTVLDVDLFPAELLRLLATAREELDQHVNDRGKCVMCQVSFPCERASLADLALGAF